jgi:predicted porin
LGFLGSEDLGGGTRVGLKLETQINMATGAVASATTGYAQATTGTSEFFNRAAFLSLSNNTFGEARIGRQVVPLYESVVTVDALSLNSMGMISYFVHANVLDATNAITGQNAGEKIGNASTSQTGPGLFNNGISYKTPTLAGWGAKVFTSPGSGNTNIQNSGAIHEGVVTYGANGFNAVLGYGEMNGSTTGTVALRRSIVGANYTWDRFKFTASHGYVQFRNEIGGVYTLTGDNTAINSVGVRYQVSGPAWVGAEFTKAKDKRLADTWSSTTGLAAGYEFSKRTNVYAFAGSVQNSGNAKMLPVYGSSATGTAGNDYTAYVVGIRHSF